MPGIGSTGLYIDENDNHYAAQICGKSFTVTDGKPVFSGNFEVMCTFRDGTTKLVSNVPPAQLFEPDGTTPAP